MFIIVEKGRDDAIKDVVNDEIAIFLNSILDSYIGMVVVLEEKARKERLGKLNYIH